MRKLSGLFIVAAVTGAIWWQSPGHTTRTLSAQTGRSGSEAKASSNEQLARDLMKDARQRASKGDIVGAKRKATEASRYPVKWSKDELSPSQFLAQLDGQAPASGRPATMNPGSVSGRPTSRRSDVVTAEAVEEPAQIERVQYEAQPVAAGPYQRPQATQPQYGNQPQQQSQYLAQPEYSPARSNASAATYTGPNPNVKARVDDYMNRANNAWLDGDTDEAVRYASLAAVLGEGVTFRAGEETPEAFIAKVRTRRAPARPTVAAQPQQMQMQPQPQPQQAVRAVNGYEDFGGAELAQATEPRKLNTFPPARSAQEAAQPAMQPQAPAPRALPAAQPVAKPAAQQPAAQQPVVRQPITREPALSEVGFDDQEPVRAPTRTTPAATPVAKPQPAKAAAMPLNFDDEEPAKPAAPRPVAQQPQPARTSTLPAPKKTEPAAQFSNSKPIAAAKQPEAPNPAPQVAAQAAAAKKSASTLMAAAKQELANGNYDLAYEKAVLASQMDVAWGVFDERPQQLMTQIERSQRRAVEEAEQLAQVEAAKAAEAAHATASRATAAVKSAVPTRSAVEGALAASFNDEVTTAKRVAKKVVEIPDSAEEHVAQPQSRGQINETQHAKQLVTEARQLLRDGQYDEARATALKAQSLGQSFGIFDDRPETVLKDIDRRADSVTLTKATEPQPTARTAAKTGLGPATDAQSDQSDRRAQAQKLLAGAKQAAAAGDLDRARQMAEQAQGLNTTYDIFDERPEIVLADIERIATRKQPGKQAGSQGPLHQETPRAALTQKTNLMPDRLMPDMEGPAPQKTAAKRPSFEGADSPAMAKSAPSATSRQAAALLNEARSLLKQGKYEEAKAKAEQAQQLDVTYDLFADQPQMVMADIAKVENQKIAGNRKGRTVPTLPDASEDPAPRGQVAGRDAEPISAPGADDEPRSPTANSQREQARQLLAQARQDLEQGRLIEARRKAEYVRDMELTFGTFDDRPEAVLALVAQHGPQNQMVADAGGEPEMLPFNGNTRSMPASFRNGDATSTVHPSGVSANDLFRQGQTALKAGDRQAAYKAFMAAHQSGQKLDTFKAQQLQDYLRDLSPRNGGAKIQLTSGQVEGEPGTLLPEVGPLDNARPIDVAEQRDQIKFDRLRSEVLNAMLRADTLKDKRPDEAIDVLDKAMAEVENSGFDGQRVAPLMGQLRKTRGSVEGLMAQKAPIIELERRNAEVKKELDATRGNAIRVRKEFAQLVDDFNRANDARDYARAHLIAKQARELNPEDPVAVDMFYRSQLQMRVASNEKLKEAKEEGFWGALNEVERGLAYDRVDMDGKGFKFSDDWKSKSSKRLKNFSPDARPKTEDERRIEESLSKKISLHFDNAPLMEVIKYISTTQGINVALDRAGLEEEGITTNTPVTIDLDNIMVKSALKLMLEPLHLGYNVEDDVLKVTSHIRQQGKLVAAAYPVADLVVSMRGVANKATGPFSADVFGGQMSVSPVSGTRNSGQFQVAAGGSNALGMANGNGLDVDLSGQGPRQQYEFNTLVNLITSVVEPGSWTELGGQGQIRTNETTLSLVIRQTQQVHQEIADLLEQLRRLQDLQITIEVRLINVSDRFFEQIGVDFDFDFQDTVGGPLYNTTGGAAGQAGGQGGQQAQGGGLVPLPAFGSQQVQQQNGNQQGGQNQQGQQNQGGQAQAQAGAAGNTFTYATNRNLVERDNWGRNGTVIGLANQSGQFTPDLDVAFRQGSFDLGLPDFGNPQATAGIQVGMAILSDIETFFFIQAAQGDERANLLFAPKITMFNGDLATITDSTQRPFVASLQPTVGAFSVGFAPVISVINDGITLSVQAVASADRRFVRLAVSPNFNNLIEIQTFSFASGGVGGAGGGQQQQGGLGGQQGGLGGQGGGLGGGGGGLFGVGGIGGGPAMQMAKTSGSRPIGRFGRGLSGMDLHANNPMMGFGGIGGGGFGGGGIGGGGVGGGAQGQQQGNQQGQQGQQGGAGGATTVQQPIIETINVTTTVSVPDGGTVLLGGIKRLKEGRNMTGVPILNKIPYISRLFKNSGVGRETESLMLMVTPRIIIFEEEEELLGIELD